jgi:hypothetical protein
MKNLSVECTENSESSAMFYPRIPQISSFKNCKESSVICVICGHNLPGRWDEGERARWTIISWA